jgi:hypothetical protein
MYAKAISRVQEHVSPRTMNGVSPGFDEFTTDGFYVTDAYGQLHSDLVGFPRRQFGDDQFDEVIGRMQLMF